MTEAMRDLLRSVRDGSAQRLPFGLEVLRAVSDGLIRQDIHGVFSVTPAGLAALAEWEAAACPKCGGTMRPGIAMGQTYTAGTPDFGPDGEVRTFSAGGPGEVVQVRKCTKCGHSTT